MMHSIIMRMISHPVLSFRLYLYLTFNFKEEINHGLLYGIYIQFSNITLLSFLL